jgi:hypothetical protein
MHDIGIALTVKSVAGIFGIWFAWFMVRLKNHYLLFLYSTLVIVGFILILLVPSKLTILLGYFLTGLSYGAIFLAIPVIISGGRGGSKMFVVSFGLVLFLDTLSWNISSTILGSVMHSSVSYKTFILAGMISAIIGSLLLIPVKPELFNGAPPKRKSVLQPRFREPVLVALQFFIPLYNIYYIIHLSYRLHGEINSLKPTRNLLSPTGGALCTIFLQILIPIINFSLNNHLIKQKKENETRYYDNWLIVLCAFIFAPLSYAFIQANLNRAINSRTITK